MTVLWAIQNTLAFLFLLNPARFVRTKKITRPPSHALQPLHENYTNHRVFIIFFFFISFLILLLLLLRSPLTPSVHRVLPLFFLLLLLIVVVIGLLSITLRQRQLLRIRGPQQLAIVG